MICNLHANAYAFAVAFKWQRIANVAFLNEMKINERVSHFALITPLFLTPILRHSSQFVFLYD